MSTKQQPSTSLERDNNRLANTWLTWESDSLVFDPSSFILGAQGGTSRVGGEMTLLFVFKVENNLLPAATNSLHLASSSALVLALFPSHAFASNEEAATSVQHSLVGIVVFLFTCKCSILRTFKKLNTERCCSNKRPVSIYRSSSLCACLNWEPGMFSCWSWTRTGASLYFCLQKNGHKIIKWQGNQLSSHAEFSPIQEPDHSGSSPALCFEEKRASLWTTPSYGDIHGQSLRREARKGSHFKWSCFKLYI